MNTKFLSIAALALCASICHQHSTVQSIRLRAKQEVGNEGSERQHENEVSAQTEPTFLEDRLAKREENHAFTRKIQKAGGVIGTVTTCFTGPIGAAVTAGVYGLHKEGKKIRNKRGQRNKIAKIEEVENLAQLLEGLIATYLRRSELKRVHDYSHKPWSAYQKQKKEIRAWKKANHAPSANGKSIMYNIIHVLYRLHTTEPAWFQLLAERKNEKVYVFPILHQFSIIVQNKEQGGEQTFSDVTKQKGDEGFDLSRQKILKDFFDNLSHSEKAKIIELYKTKFSGLAARTPYKRQKAADEARRSAWWDKELNYYGSHHSSGNNSVSTGGDLAYRHQSSPL